MTATPSPTWSRDTKRIVAVAILIAVLALLYLAREVIPTLVIAGVLAYLLQPVVDGLTRRRVPRALAAALCLLLVLLLLAIVPLLLIPAVVGSVRAMIDVFSRLPELINSIDALIQQAPTIRLLGNEIDLGAAALAAQSSITQNLREFQLPDLQSLISYGLNGLRTATGVVRTAADIAAALVSLVLSGLLLLVYLFYLTKDGNQISAWFDQLVTPNYHDEMQEMGRRLNVTWKRFFRGQLLLSLTVGVVVFLVTAAMGLPGAFVLGILAGVLEVVPGLGPVLAMVPAVIIALIEGPTFLPVSNLVFAGIVVLVYVLIQQVENNVLVPRIMGQSLNLHPLIVLIGVIVGASVGGVLGAFLAAPVLASIKIIGWYAHAKLTDRPPFAEPMSGSPLVPSTILPAQISALLKGASPPADQSAQEVADGGAANGGQAADITHSGETA